MPSKYPARNLTDQQIDECLVLLARRGGNCARTAIELKERWGQGPDKDTLRGWKNSRYFDRYHQLAGELSAEAKDKAITQGFREAVQEAQDIASELRERLADRIDEIEPKDIAKNLQQLGVYQGIATEKALLLEGRPTVISESRSPDWYEGKLAELLSGEGVVDAEVVDG